MMGECGRAKIHPVDRNFCKKKNWRAKMKTPVVRREGWTCLPQNEGNINFDAPFNYGRVGVSIRVLL
jgi:hypothetical protein